MNNCILIFLVLGLAACSSRPPRPIVGAGLTTENISGHFNFDMASLVGVDLLLDAGSTAFFLNDSNGSVVILKARNNRGGLSFSIFEYKTPERNLGLSERRAIADRIERNIAASKSRTATIELSALLRGGGELQAIEHWKQIW